jgi:hypothetical protein
MTQRIKVMSDELEEIKPEPRKNETFSEKLGRIFWW